jgi:hypothetical protein
VRVTRTEEGSNTRAYAEPTKTDPRQLTGIHRAAEGQRGVHLGLTLNFSFALL